jgi:fibronectin type 3 domain-containing protein
MPEIKKYFDYLKTKPFNLTLVLIASLFFSVILAPASPSEKAMAADITLAWDHNSEPDLAGYKLYIGNSPQNYTQFIDLGLTTQYTIGNLIDGTVYFFTLTAYNQKGFESSFSNEVRYPLIEYTHKTFLPMVVQGN